MPQHRKTRTGWKILSPLAVMATMAAMPIMMALDPNPDPEPLGDAGKKALEEERKARKEAERRAREADEAKQAAERERDELRQKTQTDHERALEEARSEGFTAGKSEAEQAAAEDRKRLLSDRLADRVALAASVPRKIGDDAKRFVEPADVARFLDLETLTDEHGQPDEAAITAALTDLASSKPYLVAGETPPFHEPSRGPQPKPPDDLEAKVKSNVERLKQQVGTG